MDTAGRWTMPQGYTPGPTVKLEKCVINVFILSDSPVLQASLPYHLWYALSSVAHSRSEPVSPLSVLSVCPYLSSRVVQKLSQSPQASLF